MCNPVQILSFSLIHSRIISSVLSSDTNELRKRAVAIEKDKESPDKDVLEMLKAYGVKQPEEQGKYRTESGA